MAESYQIDRLTSQANADDLEISFVSADNNPNEMTKAPIGKVVSQGPPKRKTRAETIADML